MKVKKSLKKLHLGKLTIANLDDAKLTEVVGGKMRQTRGTCEWTQEYKTCSCNGHC